MIPVLGLTLLATLLIAIPTKDGVVLASDSRTKTGSSYCDERIKVVPLERPPRTAFAVSGTTMVLPNQALVNRDPCEALRTVTPLFDLQAIVTEYLEGRGQELTRELVRKLADTVIKGFNQYLQRNPDEHIRFTRGNNLFEIMLADYTPPAKRARVVTVHFRIRSDRVQPEVKDIGWETVLPNDNMPCVIEGNPLFLNQYVLKNTELASLADFRSLIADTRRVAEVSSQEAARAAASLIRATSEMTELTSSDYAVGGPAQIFLVGRPQKPQRLYVK